MKYSCTLLLFFVFVSALWAQKDGAIIIEDNANETKVSVAPDGEIKVKVARDDKAKFAERGWVNYGDFGAKGDGVTDDLVVIAATHAYANRNRLPVKETHRKHYYIGGSAITAEIQTDTDFGEGVFIIDDRNVEDRTSHVFAVTSTFEPFIPKGVTKLKRNQRKISTDLPGTCLITVQDANVKRYIRFGPNQNNGSAQTDVFIVDSKGNVDMDAPIIWDFDQITSISALPLDTDTLTIKGGRFTTIANQAESKYTYYNRGLSIRRSNVVIDGIYHEVTGEGDHGAPYGGFLSISECAYVTVKNAVLTGRKVYQTIGSAGVPVSMGSYDISMSKALNVTFVNSSQTNDINDSGYWGIMGSNFCKNLIVDGCEFSRFDAHMGVANATIRNSTLGHQGINAIGTGLLLIENSTLNGRAIVNLRSDYGSTWEGELHIKNVHFVPAAGKGIQPILITGANSGQHDFGYTCYMPRQILIEGLTVDDSNHPDGYDGPVLFGEFNRERIDDSYTEAFPYVLTKKVEIRNLTITSGKELRVSQNPVMFRSVNVTYR